MVKAAVDIFEHEDGIVSKVREKYGFRNKNDALNFIIREFEVRLKDEEAITRDVVKEVQKQTGTGIFEGGKKKGKRMKVHKLPRKGQSIERLKSVMSE